MHIIHSSCSPPSKSRTWNWINLKSTERRFAHIMTDGGIAKSMTEVLFKDEHYSWTPAQAGVHLRHTSWMTRNSVHGKKLVHGNPSRIVGPCQCSVPCCMEFCESCSRQWYILIVTSPAPCGTCGWGRLRTNTTSANQSRWWGRASLSLGKPRFCRFCGMSVGSPRLGHKAVTAFRRFRAAIPFSGDSP